jgi:hypothetical protein
LKAEKSQAQQHKKKSKGWPTKASESSLCQDLEKLSRGWGEAKHKRNLVDHSGVSTEIRQKPTKLPSFFGLPVQVGVIFSKRYAYRGQNNIKGLISLEKNNLCVRSSNAFQTFLKAGTM